MIKDVNNIATVDANSSDRRNPSPGGDSLHMLNFLNGIKDGTKLNADILSGHQSTLLVQLGNIALRIGNTLHLDPSNGHIKNDKVASKLWSREYEHGWEPTI